MQNQLLACLQWLGEFQILAFIPLSGSVSAKDVADLADVPELVLCRVIRMTATAGFLSEPQPGCIAHTALSAPFVTTLHYLDATMFLAGTAAPMALQMAAATQRHGESDSPSESAYTVAFNSSQTFKSACEQQAKLHSQWSAYLRCAGDTSDNVTEILGQLDWRRLGNAYIVDVRYIHSEFCSLLSNILLISRLAYMQIGAPSTKTATALTEMYPALHIIVQVSEPASCNGSIEMGKAKDSSSRIVVQERAPGGLQPVKDAAVYIYRVPTLSTAMLSQPLTTSVLSELRTHLGVLRVNTAATLLVLVPSFLPGPGNVDPGVEAKARLWDLFRLQLANERDIELGELVEIINKVQDNMGSLVVVNKLRSRDSATTALAIKYQAHTIRYSEMESTMK